MPNITGTLRQQALDELLNDIARFKRDWLWPERAAFLAAVARQQSRRAA